MNPAVKGKKTDEAEFLPDTDADADSAGRVPDDRRGENVLLRGRTIGRKFAEIKQKVKPLIVGKKEIRKLLDQTSEKH